MRPSFLIGALLIAICIILLMQFWPEPEPVTLPTPATPSAESLDIVEPGPAVQQPDIDEPAVVDSTAPLTTEPETAAEPLPALADSDEFVRQQLASWLLPDVWLEQTDLLARAAVLVQNAAEGQVPRSQLAFLMPAENYQVVQQAERFFVEPASYARYDGLVDVLEAIPPADLAAFVTLVSPRLIDGLALLGERRSPSELLAMAITRLEQIPTLPAQVELLRPNVMYTYADPTLEALTDFEKQMLRIGPQNLDRIRLYLAEFVKNYQLK